MTPRSAALRDRHFPVFLELVVVLGLPVLSIFVGSTLAIVAYTRGFTALPEPPAIAVPHQSAQHPLAQHQR